MFKILTGKRLVSALSTTGDRPVIGALDNNNGVALFVNDTNASLDKNVLGVSYNGKGMVIGFYHPYECIFSDDVKRFHLKYNDDNEFVLLFMKVAILQQKANFVICINLMRNAWRIPELCSLLRVKERLIINTCNSIQKNMMLLKYTQYLAYFDSRQN